MYELPVEIEVSGKKFHIRNDGDYRMVLDCFAALNDPDLKDGERVIAALIIFFDGFEDLEDLQKLGNVEEATKAMYDWFEAGRPQQVVTNNVSLFNWNEDSAMICASINKVAGMEVRSAQYLHWWTFMGYFMGIGEGTFATVISIRSKITKNKKLDKWEQDFRRENPQYFNWTKNAIAEAEADEWFNEVWNKE